MKLKTATLLGLIGAIISICCTFFYVLLNFGVGYELFHKINWLFQICNLFSGISLAIFFFTLYKNQK